MATQASSMLTEAIAAARAGERSRARELLSRLLRSESSNVEYWIWMSSVVDSERERIYCLESALRLDPTNRAAMRGLVVLGARKPDQTELASAAGIPKRKVERKTPIVPEAPKPKPKDPFPWQLVASGGLGLLAIVILVALAIFVVPRVLALFQTRTFQPAAELPPPSPTATATPKPGTPTATPLPAATRIVRTPIPTVVASTPLSLLVASTATPTPVYGVTPHAFEAYQTGINALIRGDYEMVLEQMEQVIEADPNSADAHYFRAEAYRYLDQIGNALQAYDRAVTMNSEYAAAYLGRGRALLTRDQDAAEEDFNTALRIDPGLTEAYLELGRLYTERGSLLKLQAVMSNALERGVDTPMIYIYLSDAQRRLGEYDEALELALEGSANDPALLQGYLAVGQAYVVLGINSFDETHFNSALWPLQTYLAYSPDDHVGWATFGRALVGAGDFEQALAALNRAIELAERNVAALIARGVLFYEIGDYTRSLEDLTSARRFSSPTYELYMTTARTNQSLRDFEAAFDFANQAIEKAKDEPKFNYREMKVAEAYALRALIAESIGDQEMRDYAILNWEWLLSLSNVYPDTRQMAEQHLAELTGEAPTRTPTVTLESSPTPLATSLATPSATPTP
jgi:tetratricopeptide (TPR) repeat protein